MDLLILSEKYYDEMLRLLHDICIIPAPSGFEDKRAEFVCNYLKNLGIENAHIDEAKNVVCTLGEETDDIVLFEAHTDTVFPFEVPLNYVDDGEKIYCPGVIDDVACLVIMLAGIKYIVENNIKLNRTLMFVANACEEGLGNLKGTRQIFKDYGDRISHMYTFDGGYKHIVNDSVGSHRYKVTALTEGGHSFGAFGNRNAINVLAGIINEIYKIEVPQREGSKTTYNVGIIEGGTSVNTIAQNASMLCEYRSDNVECLKIMEKKYAEIFENAKANCQELKVELVGNRPCMDNMDMEKLNKLSDFVCSVQEKYGKCEVKRDSGSTDANIPHSLGVPAICVGVYVGGGAHTTEEWLLKESLKPGFAIGLELMLTDGWVI
ncbi:MAG: M20/M25/M40 family metallo-hydrolase [Clostridia bacterium]|nr:M20/M25/M40 family metallo-hydrolase [Clostridia bacterium]